MKITLNELYALLGRVVLLHLNDMITDEEYELFCMIIKEKIDNISCGNI